MFIHLLLLIQLIIKVITQTYNLVSLLILMFLLVLSQCAAIVLALQT